MKNSQESLFLLRFLRILQEKLNFDIRYALFFFSISSQVARGLKKEKNFLAVAPTSFSLTDADCLLNILTD